MSTIHHNPDGFTLIEITMVLVLLGILAAVAVPKYFDLEEEAEKEAVLASAAEIQVRLEATFGGKVLDGMSCSDARTFAAKIENLSDDGGKNFGEFSFKTEGNGQSGSLGLKYSRGDDQWKDVAGFSLVLPQCSSDDLIGYSALGREVYNQFMSGDFETGKVKDGKNLFELKHINNNRTEMHVWDGLEGETYCRIQRDTKKIDRAVVVYDQYHTGKNLLKALDQNETVEQRNSDIDFYRTHLHNFNDIFRVETRTTASGEEYGVLVWKGSQTI